MAKKKNNMVNPLGASAYTNAPDPGDSMFADPNEMLMVMMYLKGVTPEAYSRFVEEHRQALDGFSGEVAGNPVMKEIMTKALVGLIIGDSEDSFMGADDDFPARADIGPSDRKKGSDLTFVLKIKMDDVSKPPFWREISIPANADFFNLYMAIMDVMRFDGTHLWHFALKPYSEVQITDDEEAEYGIQPDRLTLIDYIDRFGEKFSFVYDYGDDWIFTITVKKIEERKSKCPQLLAWKGDLQPMEDSGGINAYLEMRETVGKKASDPKVKELAARYGFDSPDDYLKQIDELLIDPDEINSLLEDIKVNG